MGALNRFYEVPGVVLPGQKAPTAIAAASQYCWVKQTEAGEVAVFAADTDRPLGVLQNAPVAAGDTAAVMVSGISIVRAGGSIDVSGGSVDVGPDAEGKAVARAAGAPTKYIAGIALGDATDEDFVAVLLVTPRLALTAN